MKKIMVVTGTRADYGIYYPILEALREAEDFRLRLLVTGMHLSPSYGRTVDHIERDGFPIAARVESLFQHSSHGNMARSVAMGILGMTQVFESEQPDLVLVLGDRGEMLAAAITASHMNIPLAHLHGGEVSGTIDESVRHAISKLAHLHLPATRGSRERLIQMGEDPWRIRVVGAPRIETIRNAPFPDLDAVRRKYGLDGADAYRLFVYHPVTTQAADLKELRKMLRVLASSGVNTVCIRPNADAGTADIVSVYREFERENAFRWVTSFEQLDYLTVLEHAEVLIGNSSSGIIEAASFGVPVINIGSRQFGRERSANVIDIEESADALSKALELLEDASFRAGLAAARNVYEQPNTSSLVLEALREIDDPRAWVQKTIAY